MIRYRGEIVEFQESPQPPSSLWGATSPDPLGPELQLIANDHTNGHLNQAQRTLLDSLESTDEEKGRAGRIGSKGGRSTGKPVHLSLHRTPTQAQKARWEAVRKAKRQGLSLRAIAKKLGMARMTVTKYARTESPPPDASAPRSVPRPRPLHPHQSTKIDEGDKFAFHLRGHIRWTTTDRHSLNGRRRLSVSKE